MPRSAAYAGSLAGQGVRLHPALYIAGIVLASYAIPLWRRERHRRVIQDLRAKSLGPFNPATHAPRLDASVSSLVAAFGEDTFRAPSLTAPIPPCADRLEYLRKAVQAAAERFQITLPVIDLQFQRMGLEEGAAAWADYRGGFMTAHIHGTDTAFAHTGDARGTWRIRVDDAFRDNDLVLTVTAAHELTHFVLWREGLDSSDEQLVEVAIVLLGYGPLMRRVRTTAQAIRLPSGAKASVIHGPGYLHPDAIDYVMWKRSEWMAS